MKSDLVFFFLWWCLNYINFLYINAIVLETSETLPRAHEGERKLKKSIYTEIN